MSGLAAFVSGAIPGYFQGKDWKEGRDDRARKRKMEDQRFDWEKKDRDWTEETRDWERQDRAHEVGERERVIKRRNEEEDFFRSLADGMDNDATLPPPGTPEAANTPPRRIAAEPPVVQPTNPADTAPQPPSTPTPPAEPPAAPTRAEPAARRVIAPPRDTFFTDAADRTNAPPEVRNLAAAADVANAAIADPATTTEQRQKATRTIRMATDAIAAHAAPVPAEMPRQAGGTQESPDMFGRSEQERAAALAQTAPSMEGRYADRKINADPRVAASTAPAQPTVPIVHERAITLPGSASARTEPAPRPQMAGIATDTRFDMDTRRAAASEAAGDDRAAAAGPLAERRLYSAMQPASPANPVPADKLPAVTPTTDEGTPQPSLDAATKTAPSTTDKGEPKMPSEKEAQKAQGTFLERYAKEAVPDIVKFYVGRGEIEKAQAYQDWAEETTVKAAMKSWAKAVHSASIGDDDGFVEGIAGAYNAKGYFDDGYTIVKEASGIQRDPNTGAIIGAQVTFKDASGQVFVQEFDGSEDLYRLGVDMLSPEQVFEYGWSRVQATDDVRDAVAKEIAKKGLGNAISADDILKAMQSMSKANLNFQALPMDQQVGLAVDFLQQYGGKTPPANMQPAADVPVAPRPKG